MPFTSQVATRDPPAACAAVPVQGVGRAGAYCCCWSLFCPVHQAALVLPCSAMRLPPRPQASPSVSNAPPSMLLPQCCHSHPLQGAGCGTAAGRPRGCGRGVRGAAAAGEQPGRPLRAAGSGGGWGRGRGGWGRRMRGWRAVVRRSGCAEVRASRSADGWSEREGTTGAVEGAGAGDSGQGGRACLRPVSERASSAVRGVWVVAAGCVVWCAWWVGVQVQGSVRECCVLSLPVRAG